MIPRQHERQQIQGAHIFLKDPAVVSATSVPIVELSDLLCSELKHSLPAYFDPR
jgi:hypothetical protein